MLHLHPSSALTEDQTREHMAPGRLQPPFRSSGELVAHRAPDRLIEDRGKLALAHDLAAMHNEPRKATALIHPADRCRSPTPGKDRSNTRCIEPARNLEQ
jgi:hypothetical protein